MRRSIFAALSLILALAAQPLLAQSATCTLPDTEGVSTECACAPGFSQGRVWGSGPYTGDSDICTAALHAGLIGLDGGNFVLTRQAGEARYDGSIANGVQTSNWGRYDASFTLTAPVAAEACGRMPPDRASYTCACPADAPARSVWGTGRYTGDSDICTAARHAGAIGAGGGVVTANAAPGQESYQGSSANGVTTRGWGRYGASFEFAAATVPAGSDAAGLPACGSLPSGAASHECACAAGSGGGSVWGSGPYTGDSDICTAALHAGAIGKAGGAVRVLVIPGLDSYSGSARNDVSTKGWGKYDPAIVFNANQ